MVTRRTYRPADKEDARCPRCRSEALVPFGTMTWCKGCLRMFDNHEIRKAEA